MNSELVSIIIPTFNEEKVIGRLLASLKKQSYEDNEIIVVDDQSTDNTVKIAEKYIKKVYKRPHADRSTQRNFGAIKARGKYLLFLDADMELSERVVSECVGLIKKGKKIGGIVIPEVSVANNYWERVKAFEREFYMESGGDELIEAARFYPRNVFEELEGYDEEITGPEDWDLPEKIREKGYKIARIEARIFHHERVLNPFKLAKKKYYYALKSHKYLSNHQISPISPKTIYLLRSVFYKKWKKLLKNPILSFGMFFMLTLEQIAGGAGYLRGRLEQRY